MHRIHLIRPTQRFHRALALTCLTTAYAVGVALLHRAAVTPAAWAGLYGVCVIAALALWGGAAGRAPVTAWLAGGMHALWLAALFFGADGALDALNGPLRSKARVAEALGGLEVWFFFCPGMVAVALGGAVHSGVMAWRSPRGRSNTAPASADTWAPCDPST